ncbi:MAG: UbiA family prenyltransferase [Planctomycetota bacterium]
MIPDPTTETTIDSPMTEPVFNNAPQSTDPVPLCVDLDGSLLRTDLLWETLFAVLGNRPRLALKVPGWIKAGKATLKDNLAREAQVDAEHLPYHDELLAFLREQKATGRTLVLATASHQSYADAVADHLDGLFDHVIGSTATDNRRGEAKVAAIKDVVGETFDYVGDSDADVPLVEACRHLYLVDPSSGLARAAEKAGKTQRTFAADPASSGLKPLIKLVRPHQWAKNALLFVPMIMAHQINLPTFGWALLGFVAFCCAASSIYIFNDLVDIDSDRRHKSKRHRPLAAATVSVPNALKLGVGLLTTAFVVAALAAWGPGGWIMLGWVALYLVLTTLYSFSLKRRLLADVILLGWLYTHRVLAGGFVTDIDVSQWLLAFSTFLFISLAFAKRYTELYNAPPGEANARRGYRAEDLPLIGNIGPTSGFMALLVFCLYLNGEMAGKLYSTPWVLWLVVPIMMFWILRVWFLAFRGELDDDPIVFAIRDRVSWACFFTGGAILLFASV